MISSLSSIQMPENALKNICSNSCDFDHSAWRESFWCQYGVAFPHSLQKAVPKRKAEYLTGRVLAANCLRKLESTSTDVARGKDGAPVWPNGFIGSISHSEKKVISCVASATDLQGLGVDIEDILDDTTAQQVAGIICNKEEQTLMTQNGFSFVEGISLIFSLKESLYKALYPLTGKIRGFEDARIQRLCTDSNTAEVKLVTDWSNTFSQDTRLTGHFENCDGTFISLFRIANHASSQHQCYAGGSD